MSNVEHKLTEAMVDEHLERILRAADSSLRYYMLPGSIDNMRAAMIDAMIAALEAQ